MAASQDTIRMRKLKDENKRLKARIAGQRAAKKAQSPVKVSIEQDIDDVVMSPHHKNLPGTHNTVAKRSYAAHILHNSGSAYRCDRMLYLLIYRILAAMRVLIHFYFEEYLLIYGILIVCVLRLCFGVCVIILAIFILIFVSIISICHEHPCDSKCIYCSTFCMRTTRMYMSVSMCLCCYSVESFVAV